ncbi:uncharacterized protein LOC113233942 [Hyposmocoma kahamanoa]|uniref:uncharacterized protein LOC113233942 n=1 Tax=Hyposmocoma kahamanoa TaxID=1477025 RepID=UPI000E6D7AF2|nr:uncharacterized protein LOC113233942 [Hyposmocoma kahamanoa]
MFSLQCSYPSFMKILQICFMLSSVVELVGAMYYVQPVKKVIEDFGSIKYEYKLMDDTYGPTRYPEMLESRTAFTSGQSSIYEIITQPSNLETRKASYAVLNDLQEVTDADHIENLLTVEETTSVDTSTDIRQSNHTRVESRNKIARRMSEDEIKQKVIELYEKYQLVKDVYLTRIPAGFKKYHFSKVYKASTFIKYLHSIPRYNFKFERIDSQFSAIDDNYAQGVILMGIVWSCFGIVFSLTCIHTCFRLRAIKLTRKTFKRYRIVLSFLSTGVLVLSTSSVGQTGYTHYLRAYDTLFRIENYLWKNGHEFDLYGKHIQSYIDMFDNLDKYFNSVIESLPELHKLNIDTTKLEREMKILRLFANQTDFRDRLEMGLRYNDFIQSIRKKAEILVDGANDSANDGASGADDADDADSANDSNSVSGADDADDAIGADSDGADDADDYAKCTCYVGGADDADGAFDADDTDNSDSADDDWWPGMTSILASAPSESLAPFAS